jgi:hypothetical protein
MSNQTAVAVQAGPQPPALTPLLAKGIAIYQWAPGGNRQDAALVEAANAVLPAMEAYLQPAQPKLIEIWCRALRTATARMEDVEFTSPVIQMLCVAPHQLQAQQGSCSRSRE